MPKYRLLDCQPDDGSVPVEVMQDAGTPEEAARLVFGQNLVRGGLPRDLKAKVYHTSSTDQLTLVRLYTRMAPRR